MSASGNLEQSIKKSEKNQGKIDINLRKLVAQW